MTSNTEYEHYKFIADKGQSPLRVDKFLLNFIEYATRNKIQQAIKDSCVKVNGEIVKSNYKVKAEDIVQVIYNIPKKDKELIPEDIPLNIIYEDNEILIVDKEAGMVVHPGHGNSRGTLVNALIFHINSLPDNGVEDRPGLVHRIDKNTSGLLVIAKTEYSMSILSKKFEVRDLERKYIALVWGNIEEDKGVIAGHIGRSLKNRKVMDVFPNGEYGKHAVTNFRVIERFTYTTLVECQLETGRTHQIRTHFKHIGHPIFNDPEYGGDQIIKGTRFTKYKQFVQNCFKVCNRHALHAKSLGFTHPTTNEELLFDSVIPDDISQLVEKWRHYAKHQKY